MLHVTQRKWTMPPFCFHYWEKIVYPIMLHWFSALVSQVLKTMHWQSNNGTRTKAIETAIDKIKSSLMRVFSVWHEADFQSVLRSLSALMFVSLRNIIRGKSMLFVTNCLPYLWGAFKFFFQQFPWVLQLWSFFIKWYQKEWSIKLCIEKWRLTWNFEFTSCK